jgi:hypothetical protein
MVRKRFQIAGAIVGLLFLVGAVEHADARLRMYGDAKPRHFNWARQAQQNVPLPDQRIRLVSGYDPTYFPVSREMFLPQSGWGGWTYWDERVLFLHELGHVFDSRQLSKAERTRFRILARTRCSWWSDRCYLAGEPRKEDYNVPPGEMFAEMYAACALGMTKEQVDEVPSVSYGWVPPEGTDAAFCTLIRAAA